ncbi:MAG: zinc ribbon domain-containing protein [Verrucomicrobiota bacterium]|nr:zinc ribbon domain-containing protein [Verrucomicrobiota bacterium]MDP7048847.1 zinc ribbon domain-containing protein [Verrucomicrobiota bacterium]
MPSKNLVQGEKGLLCLKCNHLNPRDLKQCEYCNSQLFVKCKKCGAKVQRVISKCPECRHRMHKSPFRKFKRRMFRRSKKIALGEVGIIVIVAYGAYKVITMAAGKF